MKPIKRSFKLMYLVINFCGKTKEVTTTKEVRKHHSSDHKILQTLALNFFRITDYKLERLYVNLTLNLKNV